MTTHSKAVCGNRDLRACYSQSWGPAEVTSIKVCWADTEETWKETERHGQ